jgi:hypothetical protein
MAYTIHYARKYVPGVRWEELPMANFTQPLNSSIAKMMHMDMDELLSLDRRKFLAEVGAPEELGVFADDWCWLPPARTAQPALPQGWQYWFNVTRTFPRQSIARPYKRMVWVHIPVDDMDADANPFKPHHMDSMRQWNRNKEYTHDNVTIEVRMVGDERVVKLPVMLHCKPEKNRKTREGKSCRCVFKARKDTHVVQGASYGHLWTDGSVLSFWGNEVECGKEPAPCTVFMAVDA